MIAWMRLAAALTAAQAGVDGLIMEPNAHLPAKVVAEAPGCQGDLPVLGTKANDTDQWVLPESLQDIVDADKFAAVLDKMGFLDEPVTLCMLSESPGEDVPSGDTRRRRLSGTASDVLPDGTRVDEPAMKELLKDVLKPTKFSGQDCDWLLWSKSFRSEMGSFGLSEALRFAVRSLLCHRLWSGSRLCFSSFSLTCARVDVQPL